MMGMVKRLFAPKYGPVTHMNVRPADRDSTKEAEIKAAQSDLAHAIVKAERRSWEIRQELAGNVLKLVAGE